MDPFTLTALTALASQVVGILAPLIPFFNKATDAVANKVGEDVYEQGKHLYDTIHARFAKEADDGKASKVLQNFSQDPKEYAPNLENKLLLLLQADPNFATTLSQIIKTGPLQEMNFADDASVEDTHQNNELGQGTQRMIGGQRDTFKNVSQNIGSKKEPRK
jgi:hypothetical protein